MFLLLKQVADSKHMALALKRMDTLGRERSRKDSRISCLWKGQVNLINILGLKRLNGLCLDYRTPPPAPNWPLAIDINSQKSSGCDSVKLCFQKTDGQNTVSTKKPWSTNSVVSCLSTWALWHCPEAQFISTCDWLGTKESQKPCQEW